MELEARSLGKRLSNLNDAWAGDPVMMNAVIRASTGEIGGDTHLKIDHVKGCCHEGQRNSHSRKEHKQI